MEEVLEIKRRVRETSIAAYMAIKEKGLLSKRRMEVYDALYKHGPCTGGELFYRMELGRNPTHSNVTTRLGELRDLGVVKELGTTVCSITGMSVILWDVTGSLPQEAGRLVRATKTERIKCLSMALTEIKDTSTDMFSVQAAIDALKKDAEANRGIDGPEKLKGIMARVLVDTWNNHASSNFSASKKGEQ